MGTRGAFLEGSNLDAFVVAFDVKDLLAGFEAVEGFDVSVDGLFDFREGLLDIEVGIEDGDEEFVGFIFSAFVNVFVLLIKFIGLEISEAVIDLPLKCGLLVLEDFALNEEGLGFVEGFTIGFEISDGFGFDDGLIGLAGGSNGV